jgi:hypothetical protein
MNSRRRAVALTLVPAAFNSSTREGLSAYVVANTRGPLPANGIVRHLVHVINSNDFDPGSLGVRQTLANAFVIDSVELTTFFNGAQVGDPFSVAAPPTSTDFTGRWPTTVTGNIDVGFTVGKPAIIPAENTVTFYIGQQFELQPGAFVFKYTLHGTLNGSPVDLRATSPPVTASG